MKKKNNKPIVVHDYESFVISQFKSSYSFCRGMVKQGIEDYREDGDIRFVLLNLGRIIKARGYKVFETTGLSEMQINNAIESENNYNPDVINKMLEVLKIKERIREEVISGQRECKKNE